MGWLIHLLVNSITLLIVAHFFVQFHISGFGAAFFASIILSILNFIVRPILVFLTLPVTILTLGLFLFVINAITLKLTAAFMGSGFVIEGFGMAILAAIIITILNTLIQKMIVEPLRK
ncbi:phage holin family protein [Alkalihalobacterium elongatum]|uniref:phage holin family protein n=1 Tax=Alkalihalobacterium elongatum TaxID=2675466 RepID=UPI001C1FCF12|nr:phage holin family protein [Alkalihalobacterium elongatum]